MDNQSTYLSLHPNLIIVSTQQSLAWVIENISILIIIAQCYSRDMKLKVYKILKLKFYQ